jgi:type VI secretion system protein ImpA
VGLEFLMEPISDEAPCGADLEYADEFRQLEEAARGKPGSVIDPDKPGASISAIPPDWHETKNLADEILRKSKDFRAIGYLAKSEIAMGSLAQVAEIFRQTTNMAQQYWDGIYPLLDADDDHDPTMRLNALACLSDSEDALRLLRDCTLFRHPVFGPVKFRSLETALGILPESSNSTETNFSRSDAEGAVVTALENDAENLLAVREVLEASKELGAKIDELAGSRSNLDLKPLFQRLKPVADFIESLRAQPEEQGSDEVVDPATGAVSKTGQMSRDEAKRMIIRACEFLEKTEPSSPAPIFLKRAVALMDMNFLDIVRNLAPDAVGTFEHYGGRQESSE